MLKVIKIHQVIISVLPSFYVSQCTVYTLSQKVLTFKLSVPLSDHNRFSNLLHCGKAHKICYKNLHSFPPYLPYAATLPWEVKSPN